jgi:hypothetical protein
MKILAGIVGGLILAILGSLLVSVTFAAGSDGPAKGVGAFFIIWVVGMAVAVMAPSASKAWRRLLLTSSVFSFLMPLSGLIFTGAYMANNTKGGAEAAGAAIGGGLVSGALGFIGFFLGVIFLIVGLLVGRDKEIVYVERPTPTGMSKS